MSIIYADFEDPPTTLLAQFLLLKHARPSSFIGSWSQWRLWFLRRTWLSRLVLSGSFGGHDLLLDAFDIGCENTLHLGDFFCEMLLLIRSMILS